MMTNQLLSARISKDQSAPPQSCLFVKLYLSNCRYIQSVCRSYQFIHHQWPFQEPKLKVPIIYKAYLSGLNFREYLHNIWPDIWYSTSMYWILEISHWHHRTVVDISGRNPCFLFATEHLLSGGTAPPLCTIFSTHCIAKLSLEIQWYSKGPKTIFKLFYIYIYAAMSTTSWPRTSWSRWLRDSLAASALVEWRNVLTSCLVELAIALWEPWMAMEALPEPQLGRDNRRLHHLVCKTWWSCFSTCQWFCKCCRAMI